MKKSYIIAAASVFAAGALATAGHAQTTNKCYGINACKGQSACNSYKTSCKGKNACKGQGMIVTGTSSSASPRAAADAVRPIAGEEGATSLSVAPFFCPPYGDASRDHLGRSRLSI